MKWSVSTIFCLLILALSGCSDATPEIEALFPSKNKGDDKPVIYGEVLRLDSSGVILNSLGQRFSSDYSDPRNFCADKVSQEQVEGQNVFAWRRGSVVSAGGATPHNLDPRLVSVSYKPDSLDLYGLMSFGRIVKIDQWGKVDFTAPCPFFGGCDGYVRFKAISAGYNNDLYLLDEGGQLFNTKDLNNPVAFYSPRVSQVSYY